jgi:hypothetical protein
MTTDDFIDLLDRRRLVPEKVARQLRAKAAEGDDRITPKSILKYLVKKDIVSRAQAKELLETTLTVNAKVESSILGLVPLVDAPEPRPAASRPPAPKEREKIPAEPASPPPARLRPNIELSDEEPVLLDPIPSNSGIGFGLDPSSRALLDETPSDPFAGEEVTLADNKPRKDKKKRKRAKEDRDKSEWDSPLLLLGGTGLAVLVVAGIVLYWLLTRENADLLLKEANEHFEGGVYSQAIPKYQKFVTDYPGHQDYSHAKVRLGMAELWRDAESQTNSAKALETAQRVVKEIEDEPAFEADKGDGEGLSQAKRELSALLTKIATGLAAQAEASEDPQVVGERVEQANAALALTANTKYVPQRLRNDAELAAVRDTLVRVQQRQQRASDLASGLAKMDEAIQKGDTAAAFAVRQGLIKQYPVLREDPSLGEKVLKIAEAERSLVKFVEERKAAETQPASTPVVAELAVADRQGEAVQAEGAAVVRIDGALYGLKLTDGSLLWRRYVGVNGDSLPLLLESGNVVAADVQSKELVCLNAQTGKLVWRLPLEGTLAAPVLASERLLVASDAGRLYVVEPASGELVGHVQFNQPIHQPPVANEGGKRIYVLGEHSNLYTLSGDDFSCVGVHYLGHAAGGIAAPPIVALNKVIVADNSGSETCHIRVLSTNADGAVDGEVASHRLTGLVLTPLQRAGRRVAAVTTRGQATVFETSSENDESALIVLAAREPQAREQLAQFALLHEGHLWIAGRQLIKLAILPTGNQLPVRSLERDYRGDSFDYPLQAVGNLIVHVRRPAGQAGVLVAAYDAGGGPTWETELAAPPAGAPAVDSSGLRITAGSASGAIYLLDREAMTRRVQNQAERAAASSGKMPPMADALALDQGRMVLSAMGGEKLLHYRPGNPRQSVHVLELPGPLSCPPIAWRDGFVAPIGVGQVLFLSAEDGSPLAAPFQPELQPGREYRWLRPAVVGDGSALAVSDGREQLHLVSLESQPQPHLKATASANIGNSPLITHLAAAGSKVFAGNEAGRLVSFALPDLTAADPIDIGGRVDWGPHPITGGVLLSTEARELVLVGDDGAVRWRQPLQHGQPAGAPLVDGESAFVLFPEGVARISTGDGAEQAFAELGQSAIEGPVAFGPRLVVAAADGTLLVVNRP